MRVLPLILLTVALSGTGQLLLRAGAKDAVHGASGWLQLLASWPTLLGLTLWCLSTALWLVVLQRAELSYAYCLGSVNYILVPLASSRLFGETLNATRIWGMVVIFIGVVLTIYGNRHS